MFDLNQPTLSTADDIPTPYFLTIFTRLPAGKSKGLIFDSCTILISPDFASGGSGKKTVQYPFGCLSILIPIFQSSSSSINTVCQLEPLSPIVSPRFDLIME